jgi:hypothetical protein
MLIGREVKWMIVRVSSSGHIVFPAELRRRDRIKPGQLFEIESIGRGEYRLKRIGRTRNRGLVDWLLACPVKGWFEPIEQKETTDSIKPPDFG